MSSPADMKHPYHQLPEKENSPFVDQKKTFNQGEKFGLTFFLPVFPPNCPLRGTHRLCNHGWAPAKLQAYSAVHTKNTHTPFKRKGA